MEGFSTTDVKNIAGELVSSKLGDKKYSPDGAKAWTLELCNSIKKEVRERVVGSSKYKVIVQVVIGENLGQSLRVASKSWWSSETDKVASYSFENDTIVAVAMVFGCYYE